MKFFNSLRFKLVLIILCIALIPLVSLAYFQLSQFDTTISDSIKVQEDEIANSNADRMNDWIDSKIS
jgi:methyl-accepting chemotaxis protein